MADVFHVSQSNGSLPLTRSMVSILVTVFLFFRLDAVSKWDGVRGCSN